jgi:drug/metabolite transporter (DMT)-like permease
MNKSYKGIIYVFISAVLLSTSGLFIKKIQADPLSIASLRSVIAGLTLLPFLKIKEIKLKSLAWGYAIAYTLMISTFIIANKLTSSANVIALQYTGSLYLYIYSLLRKKIKVQWSNVLPMFFIVLGIFSFLLEPSKGSSFLGNLLAICSGIALAAMFELLPKIKDVSPNSLVCISNLSAAVLTFPFIPSYRDILNISFNGWIALLYLGCVQVALAYVLNAKGVQLTNSLQAMIIAMFEAVMNPIWVFVFIGEVPTIYGFTGAVLILGAVLVNIILQNRNQKEDTLYKNI